MTHCSKHDFQYRYISDTVGTTTIAICKICYTQMVMHLPGDTKWFLEKRLKMSTQHQQLERTYFDCICDHPDHTMRFTYDPDNGDLFLEFRMCHYLPWYKRILVAVKYVFGKDTCEHYDTCILKRIDYNKLLNIINNAKSFDREAVLKHDFEK